MNPTEAICLELAFSFLNPILPKKTLDPINPYLKEADAVLNENHAKKYKNWKDKVLTINNSSPRCSMQDWSLVSIVSLLSIQNTFLIPISFCLT